MQISKCRKAKTRELNLSQNTFFSREEELNNSKLFLTRNLIGKYKANRILDAPRIGFNDTFAIQAEN